MRALQGILLLCLGALTAAQAQAKDIVLTPEENGGTGNLPSGYENTTLNIIDGQWVSMVNLPTAPRNGDRLTINNKSRYATIVNGMPSTLNVEIYPLQPGQKLEFTYIAGKRLWDLNGETLKMWPSKTGAVMPDEHPRIATYEMWDGDWTAELTLPAKGNDGDIVSITSYATLGAKIKPTNVMFNYTMNISTHDQWAFVYSGAFKKWLLKTSPWANTGNTRQLPVPNKARMMVNLTSALAGNIVLPATAGDRDRIIVKTRSSQAYEIDKANTLDGAPSRLTARSQYEYVFTKETGKWERAAEPRGATYEAYQHPTGQLPRLNTSTTTVHFADANWFPTLFLPKGYGKGTRIIVDTEATYNVKVSGEGVNDVLKTGELAVFVANESGAWSRETRTVDLLLMYSDKVASALGESAARARLMQSLILTNQALENSRANFRYRVVAMRKFTAPKWKSGSMYDLRTDPTAQAWLEEVKADGLHYLSDEGYSGSWINGGKVNHVTVSDINLATTSMRYFIAFPAGGDRQSAYAQGYDELGSILGGNINAFYSNTQRITPDHGIRTGVDGKKDVVRAMNERSARIAAYR